ncbi:MAG: VCBS repeat-containing protein, partial [Clostridia bacterium]|nr:VCBS repeat-containing protein [Clostridia bacterium]
MPRSKSFFALIMGAIFFLGGCRLPSPLAAIRPPEVAGRVDEVAKAVQELLAPGQTVAEVRPLQSPDGETGRQAAIAAEDLDGDGRTELVVGYRDPEQGNGVFIAHRTPQGWQKVWQERLGPPGLDVLEVEDLTGDGRPEVIIGGIIGASAGNHLKVLTYAPSEKDGTPPYATLWENGYHRLEVGDFDGDNRQEIALWLKDTGTAMEVEVYRWAPALLFPAGFYEAEDAYTSYFPRVVDYYQEQTQRLPDAGVLWYHLALSLVRAGRPAEALTAVEKGTALKA